MHRHLTRALSRPLFALCFFLLSLASAFAQEAATVTLSSPLPCSRNGNDSFVHALPVRLNVSNKTSSELIWRLSYEDSGLKYSRSLSIPASYSGHVDLVLPCRSESFSLIVEGDGLQGRHHLYVSGNREGCNISARAKRLMIASVGNESRRRDEVEKITTCSPLDLPVLWTAYSHCQKLVLTGADCKELSAAQQQALAGAILAGLELDIIADERSAAAAAGLAIIGARRFNDSVNFHRQIGHGLGSLAITAPSNAHGSYTSSGDHRLEQIQSQLGQSIKESIKPPQVSMIGLCVLLVAFFALIGPLNFFIFARANRRRLLLTTPLIAIGASLSFLLFIIISDGFGVQGKRRVIVFLDGAHGQALTLQAQVLHSGIVTGGSFDGDGETLLSVFSKPASRSYYGRDNSMGLSPADLQIKGNRVSKGLVASRSWRLHTAARVTSSRHGVSLVKTPEGLSVTSACPATLKGFHCRVGRQCYVASGPLSPGQTLKLKPCDSLEIGSDAALNALPYADDGFFIASAEDAAALSLDILPQVLWKYEPATICGYLAVKGE